MSDHFTTLQSKGLKIQQIIMIRASPSTKKQVFTPVFTIFRFLQNFEVTMACFNNKTEEPSTFYILQQMTKMKM